MTNARITFDFGEYLIGGSPQAQISLAVYEVLKGGQPKAHINLSYLEIQKAGTPKARIALIYKEVLMLAPPEEIMTTLIYPGFGNSTTDASVPAGKDPGSTPVRGVGYSVHKKPLFKTNIATSSSGFEARYAMMAYPIWEYELTYDLLSDQSLTDALKTVMGFFLQCQGSANPFLFKDPDDYQATLSLMMPYNNSTTTFLATRSLGGFVEPVGQIDTANTVEIYQQYQHTATIPSTGPFTITVSSPTWYQDVSVFQGSTQFTAVSGAPGVGEYSVTDGVYTFNIANGTESVTITYLWVLNEGTDYTITMPNRVVLSAAPGSLLTYFTGQFFFICRFNDDQQDFEKFYDRLWDLQECKFRSILQ